MDKKQIEQLLNEDEEWLKMLISQEPEVDEIQNKLNQYIKDIEDLSKSNITLKQELIKLIDNYDQRLA